MKCFAQLLIYKAAFILTIYQNCWRLMREDHQNMTMEELVDILAQKTQRFTQLLIFKDFGSEYKECKIAIKQILVEIENRKETIVAKQSNPASA